ncbi:MAG: spondin domain-containing protein [Candidatus Poribacteria bacterium]|nr:spondin domain-containing protein [Candidatus Poribacteria bacterium]
MMRNQLFNRKVLFSLLAVVMCFGFTAMGYGQAMVSVEPAEVESPAAGEELTVSINIAGAADVVGYELVVNFDPTALSYVSGGNADYLPAGAFATPVAATDNSVKIAAASLAGAAPNADGTLAMVTFEVVEAKASTISLSDVLVSNTAATALDVTTADGMVTVAAAEEAAPADDTADAATDDAADDTAAEMPVSQMFEITLTNLTMGEHGMSGQTFSPAIFAAHPAGIKLAEAGQPANPAIIALAEGGDTSGLAALAEAAGANVMIAMNADGTRRYTMPGQSTTVTVTADIVNSSLSMGSMLVSTNDAFIAALDVPLFDEDGMPVSAELALMAYDAGSEDNTELASDIPGPLGLDAVADPAGSNERVPTVDGVIMPHEGIQGVGDVSEAFAWEEPVAMLTITPVEAPMEPVVEEPMPEPEPEPIVPGFDVTLEPGLNMISIPLMPAEPYTAKSLAEMLGATIVIQLDAATQSFDGYTVADGDDGFGIDGGKGYIVNTPAGGMVKFTGDAWDNQPEPVVEEPAAEEVAEEPAAEEAAAEEVVEEPAVEEVAEEPAAEEAAAEEVAEAPAEEAAAEETAEAPEVEDAANGDAAANGAAAAPALSTFKSAWAFVVTSDIQGMETGTVYRLVAENLRTGTIASQNITMGVRHSSAVWADLNRKSVVEAGDRLEIALYDDRGRVVSGPFQRTVTTTDIRNAFLSVDLTVGDVRPQETVLAQNFPNPFNPETWIPYQLSESTEVSIQIYDVSGRLVRTLNLGWQPVGSYMTPSSAAYWDGRNAIGERVASGIYFYTLQTSDFAATRRMVILK